MTDDQGYGDLSCMGNTDFRTPHLDDLAASGVRFTSWYANSPVCSPSRASLLTGRYPGNAGVRSILAGHRTATGLPPGMPTLATALKGLGYRTALFGKWHLGLAPGSRPEDHGFDTWLGFLAGCVDYYSHIFYWGMAGGRSWPSHDLWEGGREVWHNGEYLTDLITRRAVEWLCDHAGRDEPFFLYLPYNAPHYPMHAPKEYIDRFPELPPGRRIMAAMLAAVDDGVGAVTAELERQGVADNTLLFFTSDNGPSREVTNWLDGREDLYPGGTTGGLKGEKFSLYDGGIRMPALLSWPGRVPAGQVVSEPAVSMDLFPTVLRAAGGDPAEYELDGRDVLPALTDGALPLHDEIFWEMNDQTAVRRGKWKLVLNGQLAEGAPPEDAVHLADLDADVSESRNLKDDCPDVTKELTEAAQSWRARIEERWQNEWLPKANGTTALH
jgi:arylsulfatase A-like enzyme